MNLTRCRMKGLEALDVPIFPLRCLLLGVSAQLMMDIIHVIFYDRSREVGVWRLG